MKTIPQTITPSAPLPNEAKDAPRRGSKPVQLQVPPMRLHKATGMGYIIIEGRRKYLGRFDDPRTRERFQRMVLDLLGSGASTEVVPDPSMMEVLNAFRKHLSEFYRQADGSVSREAENYKPVVRLLADFCGELPARDFSPKWLKALRTVMIQKNWVRTYVNRQIVRVRSLFKWAASEGLVPVTVFTALGTVDGLRAGRSDAPEGDRVRPVDDVIVEVTLKHTTPIIAAMVRVQNLSGMRPGEICQLRPCDLDMTGPTWLYRPRTHKTAHHGAERIIVIGPRGQALLRPFLNRPLDAHCFSPVESESWRRHEIHGRRHTPLSCGNKPGSCVTLGRARPPRRFFDSKTYARAIVYACDKAFPAPNGIEGDEKKAWRRANRWHPHQLRHAAGTRIRREAGLEAARIALGHSVVGVTEKFYAEADLGKVTELMLRIG